MELLELTNIYSLFNGIGDSNNAPPDFIGLVLLLEYLHEPVNLVLDYLDVHIDVLSILVKFLDIIDLLDVECEVNKGVQALNVEVEDSGEHDDGLSLDQPGHEAFLEGHHDGVHGRTVLLDVEVHLLLALDEAPERVDLAIELIECDLLPSMLLRQIFRLAVDVAKM